MSNAVWFYTDAARQQQGPVDEATLEQLWRDGRIDGGTLVWREGQKQWVALSALAVAMPWQGALTQSTPPALPRTAGGAAMGPAASPKRGLSGCMIALIVGAALFVPMLGILAAIALPAYQDYVNRAHFAEALMAAAPLKAQLDETIARDGACPEGRTLAPNEHSALFRSARIGPFEDGHCGVYLELAESAQLRTFTGKKIWLWRDDVQSPWRCASEIPDRFLPQSCRG